MTVKYAFKNAGAKAVTITKVISSCGCTTAIPSKSTFLPGESGTLEAKFTFGQRRGAQSKSITVNSDDGQIEKLAFDCLITDDPVGLSSTFVYWRVGEANTDKSVEVTMGPNPPIQVQAVASSNPRIAATLTTVKAGEKYAVTIRPVDTSKPESAQVFVQTNYPAEGPKAYTIHVRVK